MPERVAMASGSSTVADKTDTAQMWGHSRLQPGERQKQLVATFAFGQGVDFVDDHPLKPVQTSAAASG